MPGSSCEVSLGYAQGWLSAQLQATRRKHYRTSGQIRSREGVELLVREIRVLIVTPLFVRLVSSRNLNRGQEAEMG